MRALLTIIVLAGAGRAAAAQWQLGVELATSTYGGSSHDTSGSHVASEGRPAGGVAFGLRVERNWARYGVALRASYAASGIIVSGSGVSLVDRTTGRLLELWSAISTRVGGVGGGPSGAIRAELGPSLHLWDFDGAVRTRAGVIAAAVYEWPIASRVTGALRLEGMLSPSWFNATDVPPDFERRATWRYGVGLGLRYRLT